MKKILALMLALAMALTFVACGNNDNNDNNVDDENNANVENNGEENVENNDEVKTPVAESATALLDKSFDSFLTTLAPAFGAASGEEIKGYFASYETETVTETDAETGEEFSYEMPKSGPGKIDLSDVDTLTSITLFPAESIEKLASASVFFNMMNMNNGTFSAFELNDAADADTIAAALKDRIANNNWMCGFPERYIIIKIDNFVVASFGLADSTNAFKDAITSTYADAVVVCDEAI